MKPESPVFDRPPGPGVLCQRCGRIFEAPLVVDGKVLAGHVQGDPVLCVPVPGAPSLTRDARQRKAGRRGQ